MSHVTIKKEAATLSSIWNRWGINKRVVSKPIPLHNLDYPKRTDKEPFQTWNKSCAKRRVTLRRLFGIVSFFLSTRSSNSPFMSGRLNIGGRIATFRGFIPCLPSVLTPVHGASEMLRARVEDVDFHADESTIREKKKDRTKKETYRHVPITPPLAEALRAWLTVHPGGDYLFCKQAGEPLSAHMAAHYFRWALEGSKWQVLRGFHCLRHSLISNLAAHSISDHVIMAIVGHLNAETTRRGHLARARWSRPWACCSGRGRSPLRRRVNSSCEMSQPRPLDAFSASICPLRAHSRTV